jgi:nucleoside-diphosphate-sugar epimerase
MARVAITGVNGKVGRALVSPVGREHEIVPIDLPETDILNTRKFYQAVKGADVVIHLAGIFGPKSKGNEHWRSPHTDPVNRELFTQTVAAAQVSGAKLFIHASSVHVEDSLGYILSGNKDLLVARPRQFLTETHSGYGKAKREQEATLEEQATGFTRGAVSLRLGGVTADNLPLRKFGDRAILEHEQRVWLEHGDLGDLVLRIIAQKDTPSYEVLYAVSNNTGRFHDTANPFGWTPEANSADYL